MNYANIKYYDIANGPGVRTSVFVSGCRHHCPGCFNAVADVVFGLHESAVHQHIQQCQQLVGHLAPRGTGLFAGKLFPSVAGIAPHRLLQRRSMGLCLRSAL